MAALRLLSVGSLIAFVNAQSTQMGWSFDALTDEQKQIITCTRNDINEDGFVGVDDLLQVLSMYHQHCGDDHAVSNQFDYETCDYDLGRLGRLCGESDECPNHPAPEPAPAIEPCPVVTPCPTPPPPPPPCPVPETCGCLSHIVAQTSDIQDQLFGDDDCELTPSELAAGSAAQTVIDTVLTAAAEDLGVSRDAVALEGTTPDGELLNTACTATGTNVQHEISIELDNSLADAMSQGDCSMDSNEIATSDEAARLTCAMARSVAASLDGVNCNENCITCNEENCLCDVVFDELTFENSGSCSGGRRRLALASSDGKTRAHLKMDPRFTAHVNAVFDSVKVATEKGLEAAAAKRRL
eukprot:SAG31_NODE_2009_length_6673_cov_3.370094_1_plen_355_part_00